MINTKGQSHRQFSPLWFLKLKQKHESIDRGVDSVAGKE